MEETFANGVPAHFDVGIVRVKAAVGRLVRFGDAAHIGDDFIGAKLVFVHMGRIAHQAHDGGFLALAEMHLHSLFLNFLNKRLHALFRCVLLENDNHDFRPPDLLLRFVLLRYSSMLPRNKKTARFFFADCFDLRIYQPNRRKPSRNFMRNANSPHRNRNTGKRRHKID